MKAIGYYWSYRHSLTVRMTHWFNAGVLLVMLMSGLQIFNAHPALYWGSASDFDKPIASIVAQLAKDGSEARGVTTIAGVSFDTTGVLGYSGGKEVAFPEWATLPASQDLARGRRWHLFFAWMLVLNGLVFLIHGVASRHLVRDLVPSISDMKQLPGSIITHLRFRFPHDKDAIGYNVLQKLTYLMLIVAVFPLIILTGLAMSPAIGAALPWLADVLAGRQSARTLHFLCALALVLFTLIHVLMVFTSGLVNNLRSMTTGYYAVKTDGADEAR